MPGEEKAALSAQLHPAVHADRKKQELDFQPPLDIVNAAARVCDPFFSGLLTGEHVFGKFLNDYKPSAW